MLLQVERGLSLHFILLDERDGQDEEGHEDGRDSRGQEYREEDGLDLGRLDDCRLQKLDCFFIVQFLQSIIEPNYRNISIRSIGQLVYPIHPVMLLLIL